MRPADSLARSVIDAAREKSVMIAAAESCTGGLVTAALTEIPGSSEVVDRGFVTYSNAAKTGMLGVPEDVLERYGAVSRETALAMAEGALRLSRAQLAVSITGIAGPGGGSPDKPVGLVWFTLSRTGASPVAQVRRFGDAGRARVRELSVETALVLVRDSIRLL